MAIIIKMKRTVNRNLCHFHTQHTHKQKPAHIWTSSESNPSPMENLRLLIRNNIFLVEHNGTHYIFVVFDRLLLFHLNVCQAYYDVVTALQTMSLIQITMVVVVEQRTLYSNHHVREIHQCSFSKILFPILSHHSQSNLQFAAGKTNNPANTNNTLHANDIC